MRYRHYSRLAAVVFRLPLVIVAVAHWAVAIPAAIGDQSQDLSSESYPSGQQLLSQAYDNMQQMSSTDRCYLLVELAAAGARLSDERLSYWVNQLFQETERVPESWNVSAMRKNAVVALAYKDPKQAISKLRTISFAHVKPGDVPPEDLRADAAKAIFPLFWGQSKSLEAIESAAMAIGESGQYPFVAMAPILVDVSKYDEMEAQRLFAISVGYFSRGNPTRFTTPDFVTFLLAVKEALPEYVLAAGVRAAVERLLDDHQDLFGDESFQGVTETSNGAAVTPSRKDYLLHQLLPLARRIDGKWANSIIEKNSRLKHEPVPGADSRSSTVFGSASDSQLADLHSQNLQRSRLDRIRSLLPDKPDEALKELTLLSDPTLRVQALGDIAQRLSIERPEVTKQCRTEIEQLIKSQTEFRSRLKMYLGLAKAAASQQDSLAFSQAFRKALDLGEELIHEDSDSRPPTATLELYGFEELCELAKLGAGFAPSATIRSIQTLSNPALRANALVYAAMGLRSTPASGSPQKH